MLKLGGCFKVRTLSRRRNTRGEELNASRVKTLLHQRHHIAMATTRFAHSITGATTKEIISLAYHLHEPVGSPGPLNDAPMVMMHGLFGSKQNHRSISK